MTCVNLLKLITDTIAPVPGHLAPKPQIPCKKPQEFLLFLVFPRNSFSLISITCHKGQNIEPEGPRLRESRSCAFYNIAVCLRDHPL